MAKILKISLFIPFGERNSCTFHIKKGISPLKDGWNHRGTVTCPCCGSVTDVDTVKNESCSTGLKPQLIATIYETSNGKSYGEPTLEQIEVLNKKPDGIDRPTEKMQRNSNGGDTFPWGITNWGQLFTDRQLFMLETLSKYIKQVCNQISGNVEYIKILQTYLAIWFDRIVLINTAFGRWDTARESIQHPFSRQAIAMVSDYLESNPFCHSSGSALNMLEWVVRYIESEGPGLFPATFANASSGEKNQFKEKEITATVTDPPYYDAIAYADISDFFYVWMKRTIGDLYPINFATPQTPKAEECTALKHHHHDNVDEAKKFFEQKLTQIFEAIEYQTSDEVSIMFAHQSTEAWTTLCNSIINANMNIMGSWPMDTEMANRSLGLAGAALESSVTVACRPIKRRGFGEYKKVKQNIERKVTDEVNYLRDLGFRGADLITGCFGQAAGEFGQYKVVEKADGSTVSVAELLELASDTVLKALVKSVPNEEYTRFYTTWLYLYGLEEVDFDDATKFTRVGVNINIKDIEQEQILILKGNKVHLASAKEHIGLSSVEGTRPTDPPISQAHRAILLYKAQNRQNLLHFVADICPEASSTLWRLLATMKELLPSTCDDGKQLQGLLQNAEDLRLHCQEQKSPVQLDMFTKK